MMGSDFVAVLGSIPSIVLLVATYVRIRPNIEGMDGVAELRYKPTKDQKNILVARGRLERPNDAFKGRCLMPTWRPRNCFTARGGFEPPSLTALLSESSLSRHFEYLALVFFL
jgi:hypothetical protein